ncbi:Cher-like protein [Daphnia magna]|uniref:Cher-like protein n=1 Tax=Daphnia magna TaxID=35525 RepID=A0A162QS92_9CRUS|nr:Cher-like protein [Daphnia magna]
MMNHKVDPLITPEPRTSREWHNNVQIANVSIHAPISFQTRKQGVGFTSIDSGYLWMDDHEVILTAL